MAHNLNINKQTGEASFFTVKEKAWHGLGKVLDQCPNSEEAIKLAGLDFEVGKMQVSAPIGEDGAQVPVPGKFATYRKDTGVPFGIVGSAYEVIQNSQAFKFFDAIVGEGAAIYETAGALHDGQTVFITAKLPDYIKVAKDDLIEQYLFLTSSHDGSASVRVAFTPVRIVCNNTLNAALGQMTNRVSIWHTSGAEQKLAEAHKIMGISHVMASELELIFGAMTRRSVTDQELADFIRRSLAPNQEMLKKIEARKEISQRFENIVQGVVEYAHTSPTQQMDSARGTLFGAYNAITGYYGNVRDYKSGDDKLESIISGTAYKRNQAAFNLAIGVMQGSARLS